jgi:hypothetical protein
MNTYHIPFGGFGKRLTELLITAVIGGLLIDSEISGEEITWLSIPAALCFIVVLFFPLFEAWDVKDRIPELEGVDQFKDTKIRHPRFLSILIFLLFGSVVTIFISFLMEGIFSAAFSALFLAPIFWIVAFLWSLTPGYVPLPRDVAKYLKNLDNEEENFTGDKLRQLNDLKEKKSTYSWSSPPIPVLEEPQTNQKSQEPEPKKNSIKDKLKQLNDLKVKNLINDEEYNKKKEKLLEEL